MIKVTGYELYHGFAVPEYTDDLHRFPEYMIHELFWWLHHAQPKRTLRFTGDGADLRVKMGHFNIRVDSAVYVYRALRVPGTSPELQVLGPLVEVQRPDEPVIDLTVEWPAWLATIGLEWFADRNTNIWSVRMWGHVRGHFLLSGALSGDADQQQTTSTVVQPVPPPPPPSSVDDEFADSWTPSVTGGGGVDQMEPAAPDIRIFGTMTPGSTGFQRLRVLAETKVGPVLVITSQVLHSTLEHTIEELAAAGAAALQGKGDYKQFPFQTFSFAAGMRPLLNFCDRYRDQNAAMLGHEQTVARIKKTLENQGESDASGNH